MTQQNFKFRGWKKKKADWSRPYKPSAYDLERDPTLAEKREPFEWKSLRDFKAQERAKNPVSSEDVCYRTFKRRYQ